MSGAVAAGGAQSAGLGAAAAGCCSSVSGAGSAALLSGGSGIAGRLPSRVLEHIFSYLELMDLLNCSLVCWHWNNCLSDENSEVWRSLCARSLSDEALRSDILCNLASYKGKVRLCSLIVLINAFCNINNNAVLLFMYNFLNSSFDYLTCFCSLHAWRENVELFACEFQIRNVKLHFSYFFISYLFDTVMLLGKLLMVFSYDVICKY